MASGAADLAHRVLVEGHLADCAPCRREVAALARPGGPLLAGIASIAEEAVPPDAWPRLAARVRSEPRPAAADGAAALAGIPLPEAALRELPDAVLASPPRWRSAWAPGARFAVLGGGRMLGAALVVGRMGPGRGFPSHLHPGREDVLVLAGGYADHRGTYEAGDYAVYEPGSAHRPFSEPGEECWVLTRLERPVRFTGWRGWLQRLLRAAARTGR